MCVVAEIFELAGTRNTCILCNDCACSQAWIFLSLNVLQCVAHCVAVCCSVLQSVAVRCSVYVYIYVCLRCNLRTYDKFSSKCFRKHTFISTYTLQHTATHCNTLQHTATHCNTLQHTATHCNNENSREMQLMIFLCGLRPIRDSR